MNPNIEKLFLKHGLALCEANELLLLENHAGDFSQDQLEEDILELGDRLARAVEELPSEEEEHRAAQKRYADYIRGLKRQSGESQEAYLARLRRESRREMHQGLERAAEGVKPLLSMTTSELREKVRRDSEKPEPGWPALPHQYRTLDSQVITLDRETLISIIRNDPDEYRRLKRVYGPGDTQINARLNGIA